MKHAVKALIYAGVPFGIFVGLCIGILNGFDAGVFAGLFSGLLFGLTLSIFAEVQKRKFKKFGLQITNGKKIIMDGGANHFKGVEGVGGWLFLTGDELIFKSHAFNVQRHQIIIPLNEIIEVKAVPTAGIIPNGLLIKTNDSTERFVVYNRNTWIKKINEAISALRRGFTGTIG